MQSHRISWCQGPTKACGPTAMAVTTIKALTSSMAAAHQPVSMPLKFSMIVQMQGIRRNAVHGSFLHQVQALVR